MPLGEAELLHRAHSSAGQGGGGGLSRAGPAFSAQTDRGQWGLIRCSDSLMATDGGMAGAAAGEKREYPE